MPKELVDTDSFTLSAGAATVEVLSDALVLNLSLAMGFARRAPTTP